MIKSVAQIGSKITACCHFIQLIENRLVPSMLAAGANGKIALVRIFCENELCNPNGWFIPPVFLFYPQQCSSLQNISLDCLTFSLLDV